MKSPGEIGLILFLLGLTSCAPGQFSIEPLPQSGASRDAPDAYAALGKEAFLNGNLGLAVTHYQAAITRSPNSIESLNGLAASYDRLGRFDLARRYYDRALKLDPLSAQTLNNVGYSYLLQGKRELAALFLQQAVASAEGNSKILSNLELTKANQTDHLPSGDHDTTEASATQLPADKQLGDQVPNRQGTPKRLQVSIERATPLIQMLVERPVVSESGKTTFIKGDEERASATAETPEIEKSDSAQVQPEALPSPSATAFASPSIQRMPTRAPIIEVANGTGRRKMAARMRAYLQTKRFLIARLTNASSFSNRVTTISYRPGWSSEAREVAIALPNAPALKVDDTSYADVRITLGADLLDFDADLLARTLEGHQYAAR